MFDLEIKQKIEDVGKAVEEFKAYLPTYIKEKTDPLVEAQMKKINEAVSVAEEAKAASESAVAVTKKLEALKSNFAQKLMSEHDSAQRIEIIRRLKGMKDNPTDKIDTLSVFQKSFNTGSVPDGAALVLPYFDSAILILQQEYSELRKYAAQITISSSSYERVKTEDNASYSWGTDYTPTNNNDPNQYAIEKIDVKDLFVRIPIPQNLLDDAFFNLDTEIMRQASEKFSLGEAEGFFIGNGVRNPRGFLTYPDGSTWDTFEQIKSGSDTAISYEALMKMVYSLLSFYQKNAVFMAHRTTIEQLRLITYGAAYPVPMWQPSLIAGQPSTLLGYPMVYSPSMPAFATNALCLAFGDFSKGYKIVDRVGMTLLRDPYTAHPLVKYIFHKRVGGGQEDYRAIKLMKITD